MSDATNRVGLLGTGLMGSAMGRRLLHEGLPVAAWDREPDHVRPLAERGAVAAAAPQDVLAGAQAVITMLPTAGAVLEVVEPLLEAWPRETAWLQMSSVGVAEAEHLAGLAAAHGITIVDAPVSGSTHPAEEGRLTILASGPDSARAEVEPILTALGSRVQWVGPAGMGSRLKLAANHWMIASVATLAETMHLCEAMGLEGRHFVDLLEGGPLGSAYAVEKLGEMRRRQYPAGFPVRLALKDLELVGEVARASAIRMPVLDAVIDRFGAAVSNHAGEDLAAVYELPSGVAGR